ncbi:YceI-like domain-containing protein [Tenacibaculum sp. MAR_2009_124]|uniref:YceI family protein n=1 Tax=Tenacibaculum sp. MAR_2009_124 TaxID=1250059 RepID=UPI0008981CB3|nr:YceI family protein [Tenacibaculum sp. MAR_2009_124]SEC31011.1 YceI-like domain-containing protein [Tenacibaculum sp. MAR_2009_124]
MNKLFTLLIIFSLFAFRDSIPKQYIARQGQVTFFSYASVENIEAKNNQVLSILDLEKKEIAISMLMRAFIFKKDLMHEHFNESYIESDIYPKATFEGALKNFDPEDTTKQTKLIHGTITIHGISKEIDIKATINKTQRGYHLLGEFNLTVQDFNIKIPPILANNIAKVVLVKFNFQYLPYEND